MKYFSKSIFKCHWRHVLEAPFQMIAGAGFLATTWQKSGICSTVSSLQFPLAHVQFKVHLSVLQTNKVAIHSEKNSHSNLFQSQNVRSNLNEQRKFKKMAKKISSLQTSHHNKMLQCIFFFFFFSFLEQSIEVKTCKGRTYSNQKHPKYGETSVLLLTNPGLFALRILSPRSGNPNFYICTFLFCLSRVRKYLTGMKPNFSVCNNTARPGVTPE